MKNRPMTLHPAENGRHRANYDMASYARDWTTYHGKVRAPGRHDATTEVRAELDTPIDLAAVRVGLSLAGVA